MIFKWVSENYNKNASFVFYNFNFTDMYIFSFKPRYNWWWNKNETIGNDNGSVDMWGD